MRQRRVVRMAYARADGTASQRTLWPLGLFFWGRNWTLVGCTVSPGFRFDGFELAAPGFDIPG